MTLSGCTADIYTQLFDSVNISFHIVCDLSARLYKAELGITV